MRQPEGTAGAPTTSSGRESISSPIILNTYPTKRRKTTKRPSQREAAGGLPSVPADHPYYRCDSPNSYACVLSFRFYLFYYLLSSLLSTSLNRVNEVCCSVEQCTVCN